MGIADAISTRLVALQADAGFRRRAAAFPPSRPIARRRAGALFDLCGGFVYSQVLAAAMRLDLPGTLRATPMTARDVGASCGLGEPEAERLLRAAASLGIAARRGRDGDGRTRWGLGATGAALIDNDGVRAMIAHHALLYDDLRDPVALLRGEASPTRLGAFWPYARKASGGAEATPEDASAYSALMSASQSMLAGMILDAYPFGRHRALLDVGGGDGSFIVEAAGRAPGLALALFDLPPVAAIAGRRLAAAGLAQRARVFGGDLKRDTLPRGADLVTLVRVLHDHDDDTVRAILAAIRRAIAPGGRLLIAEPMAGGRAGDAYFGFYLLAMAGGPAGAGLARSPRRLRALLREAGFAAIRSLPTQVPMLARIVVARG